MYNGSICGFSSFSSGIPAEEFFRHKMPKLTQHWSRKRVTQLRLRSDHSAKAFDTFIQQADPHLFSRFLALRNGIEVESLCSLKGKII